MDLEMGFIHRTPEGISLEEAFNGQRLDGKLMIMSVFFDRLHGGNEDNPFLETLEFDKGNSSAAWNVTSLDIQDYMSSFYKGQPFVSHVL